MNPKFCLAACAALFSTGCSQAQTQTQTAPIGAPIVSTVAQTKPAPEQNITFPDDANIINVKEAPYNAKGDGVTDDSAAIFAAFQRTGLIYFPNGTYLVSQSFAPPKRGGKSPSRRILQGQSRDGVVIKLKDNTPEFGNPADEKAVFLVSYAPEQAFRNGVRNLTIDTGKGNPGAIGMQFYASNQGGMHHVTIRSGDGQGKIGLDLNHSSNNGPLLVKDVRVEGFDKGIDGGAGHLITLENIAVENQNAIGFYAQSYAFIHGFSSVQKTKGVPALVTRGHSLVTLVDASAQGAGETALQIEGEGFFARDLKTTGYRNAIQHGAREVKGPNVAEWTAQPVLTAFTSPPRSLNLPVKATPTVPWDDPKTWANVMDFGPKTTTVGKREYFDITEALQKAIDSGATTVYLPRRSAAKPADEYHIVGTVFLRGKVRRLIGMEADVLAPPGAVDDNDGTAFDKQVGKDIPSKIVVENGEAPVVVIERLNAMYGGLVIENRSPRAVVMSSMLLVGAAALPGAGDLFFEDIAMAYLDINGNNVWARQLNTERSYGSAETNPRPNIRQNGGNLWVHGLKTEQNRTKLIVKNGNAEFSAFILANRGANPLPMFEAINSRLSVSIAEDVLRKAPFAVAVRETRGGETRELKHEDAPRKGQGKMISLFVADPGTGTAPPAAPQNLAARAETATRVALKWNAAPGADGFSVEQKEGATWKPLQTVRADETEVALSGLNVSTPYQFRVVAFNAKGQTPSAPANVTTPAPPPPGKGTGLLAVFYTSKNMTGARAPKVEGTLSYNWKIAPDGLKKGDFGVRWTGEIEPRFSQPYTFQIERYGQRLWVDGQLVINAWQPGSRTRRGTIALEAGKRVPIKWEAMEPDDKTALSWQSESTPLEVVPTSQLFPAAKPQPEVVIAAEKTRVAEGQPLTLKLQGAGAGVPTQFDYSFGGSAVAGADYTALPAQLKIGATEIQTVNDREAEPPKTLEITLKPSANYNIAGGTLELQINDDDLPKASNGTGLKTEFFSDVELTQSKGTKVDKEIDFNWDKRAPQKGLDTKGYAIRWTGQVEPLFSETYTFSAGVTPYGGARVWVDGKMLFDSTVKGGKKSGEIALKAGQKTDLKVEFINQKFYGAVMRLNWESPSQFQQVVPQSQLFPAP